MTSDRTREPTGGEGGGRSAVRGTFEWSEVPPSTAVVETVSVATDRPPLELPILDDAVDTDALDALLGQHGGDPDRTVVVSFEYAGVLVRVEATGVVSVTPGGSAE